MAERPLPETDSLAGAFWAGAREQRLLIQKCSSCGRHQHYARPRCLACNSTQVEMVSASGRGKIYSFSVVQRSPFDDLPAPYVVALVRLEEGVVMLSHIVDCKPDDVRCDQPVLVKFQPIDGDFTLPVFRTVGSHS